jgi:DNA polymerase I-like protein with 3'-5' exonuclease and polymerase domains
MSQPTTEIVFTLERFNEITTMWSPDAPVACDTETAHDSILLGISLSPSRWMPNKDPNPSGIYIPLVQWDGKTFAPQVTDEFSVLLLTWLGEQALIGHNFTYDKRFIDRLGSINSKWVADTRIMWHLSSAPEGPRPYGLKDAQVELLGWEKSNDEELKRNVEARGGNLRNGDHYLASLPILGHYAALDAIATSLVYRRLHRWFSDNDYTWMISKTMEYQLLLERGTEVGIAVDHSLLQTVHDKLNSNKEKYEKDFRKELQGTLQEIEADWRDRHAAVYKREYNRSRYLNNPEEWERFNINSDKHKRELFYDKLRLPITETTPGGKAAVTEDSVVSVLRGTLDNTTRKGLQTYLKYEHINTLTANFTQLYLKHSTDGRYHPRYNIAGTVSGRLAGFKPHLLNAPFGEKEIMQCFKCDEGWSGVHADLVAIEPTLTAHYSDDPSMLKVFRDGLGDIYLDLALEIFPNDKELKDVYNPRLPVTGAIKEHFARQRKVAKIIQLAVSYNGTGFTVAKNLSAAGIHTTPEEANVLVRQYWRKFRKVAETQYQLRELYRKQGYLVNACGRIIRVPNPEYKDLFNRFIQSGGHDVLVNWVLHIYTICNNRGLQIRPILLDCHDSTSNQCPRDRSDELKEIYKEALQKVNDELELSVPIKMEMKEFHTLAGLKAEE